MDINYKKRSLNVNLIFGIVWFIWFMLQVFTKEEPDWVDYGWAVISLMYFSFYIYRVKYKYLNIENGYIRVNGPLGKKLQLDKIKEIKKFAGDYILKTDHKEVTINTHEIDSNSLEELHKALQKLELEWK